jgi:Raf kinase inhibitor-like YbhB/YbcL family protein
MRPCILLFAFAACSHSSSDSAGSSSTATLASQSRGSASAAAPAAPAADLKVTSTAFTDGQEIPKEFTCEGANDSPPIAWSGAPAGTQSFAVIVDDPDAPDPAKPERTWVHWVIASLPATTTSLAASAAKSMPAGAAVGVNDFGDATWGGPCPPIGRHRYFFKVYALDTVLSGSPSKSDLEHAMEGHVLAKGQIIGTYQKH